MSSASHPGGGVQWMFGALLGIAMFLAVLPWRILDPRYVRWLFVEDAASHYLGWAFFRVDPWRWPPGATWRYGEAMASSIVYSDSIPLLALVFKPLAGILPPTFQYSGWWILASFALSGAFGWQIGKVATRSAFGAFAGASFAVLSPIMLDRATGHYSLTAHWLILWSLLNYLRLPRTMASTALPMWVAALVHAYLLLMVLAIWCAEQVRFAIVHQLATRRPARARFLARGFGAVLVLGLLLMLSGYFTIAGASLGGRLYGTFALNLNGLWNPQWGSAFVSSEPVRAGAEFEGFAYLGLGTILLVVIGGMGAIATRRGRLDLVRLVPLISVALLLAGFALSHEVYFGNREVLRVPLPERLMLAAGVFRASGRFVWVFYYTLVLGGIAATCAIYRGASGWLSLRPRCSCRQSTSHHGAAG